MIRALLLATAIVVAGATPAVAASHRPGKIWSAGWVDPAFTNTGGPAGPAPNYPIPGGHFHDHGIIAFGDAPVAGGGGSLTAAVVAMAGTPSGQGYWMVSAQGEVITYGDASSFGSVSGPLHAPVIGMAAPPNGLGYWVTDLNGTVYGFGSALNHGGTVGRRLHAPIVAMASTPSGLGYWLVGADGAVFNFGDAAALGSMGGKALYAPVVGMAPTPSGRGYWLVASDGGVFGFGDASFHGSMGGRPVYGSIVGIAATRSGRGYWLAGDDGAVYSFGDAHFWGANANEVPTPAVAAITATPDSGGYWLLDPAMVPSDYTGAGAPPGSPGAAIIRAAVSQLGGNPSPGYFCNPYGPCEEWCALFATWTWNQAGVPIPRYAFTGDIYNWAAGHTAVGAASIKPQPGDAILYGTGPGSVYSSFHVGIVVEVWPDGAIVTIDGDSGPGPSGSGDVVINGPFLPAFSQLYNGMPVYGYAAP